MPSTFFEGAKGFKVRILNVDNVDGNYTDLRHIYIQETDTDHEFYDQSGAVVVNCRGKLSGTINYAGFHPVTRTRKSPSPQTRCQIAPASFNIEGERRRVPLPHTHNSPDFMPTGSEKPASGSTFFENAESFDVGSMKIRNTGGDFVDQRTTEIRKDCIREEHYDQQGAVGVANGQGALSINYGLRSTTSDASRAVWRTRYA